MNWTLDQIPTQQDRTVIVTGANSGIGLQIAHVLSGQGAQVILACRDQSKAQTAVRQLQAKLPTANVSYAIVDLADLSSIRAFAAKFQAQHHHLDCLINNAGIMLPPFTKTKDGFELQFGVNHLGHFALTGLLLPCLNRAEQPRVVQVSSLSHRGSNIDFDNLNAERKYKPIAAYGQSKLANLLFILELQRRVASNHGHLIALAAHPGFTLSNLQRYTRSTWFMAKLFAQDAQSGALPILYAATAQEVNGGEYFGPKQWGELRGAPTHAKRSRQALQPDLAKKLWEVSEQLTQVRFLPEG